MCTDLRHKACLMRHEAFFIRQKKEFGMCKAFATREKTPFLKLYTTYTQFMVSEDLFSTCTL